MPRYPDAAHVTVAPDWICEVLSPSTAMLDRVKKLTIDAREHVAHAWLIDPVACCSPSGSRQDSVTDRAARHPAVL
jgi:Uma2 family endonuclease